jgi:hypothetical protein
MNYRSLTEIKRRKPEDLLALRASSSHESIIAGQQLLAEVKEFGIPVRDFLALAIDPSQSDKPEQFAGEKGALVGGYEAALQVLGLPVRDSFKDGITLNLASDTFQTFPGTRAMFPEVVDDILRWTYRQDQFEKTSDLVASSRTVNGTEVISTVVDDEAADYKVVTPVAEMSRVRVKTIRTTQNTVGFFKHGWGIRTSYEFQRRARLDLLTPYANRVNRETEMSKVGQATTLLINGDGVHAAAGEVDQSSLNGGVIGTATNGTLSYKHLLAWLINRAKVGLPVDTVVGNWDAYVQWLMMFAVPTSANVRTDAENLAAAGFRIGGVPLINGVVNFALSSTMPANKLLGMIKGETLEELIEAGSTIEESERSIINQSITYVRTVNAGYRLAWGDTRQLFDYGN